MAYKTFVLLIACSTAGCATRQSPDPYEGTNRKIFAFNESIDAAVVNQVATTCENTVPKPARTGISNFFPSLADVGSALKMILQDRPLAGLSDVGRLEINTTVGLFGLFDMSTLSGLERHGDNFGRTLAVWGLEPGAYVVWPLIGPSTARDSVGTPIDWLIHPLSYVDLAALRLGLTGTSVVDDRAIALPITKTVDAVEIDKYLHIRDAYLQRHRKRAADAETLSLDTRTQVGFN